MKLLIIGAGDVGFQLTKRLSADHNITLIEHDPQKAKRASEQLDAFVLEGHGGSYSLLRKAGIGKADIVAAMTNNDELNILICQMARRAGKANTIARVRNHEYTLPDCLIPQNELADLVIHPEKETAAAVMRLIRQSAATDVIDLVDGKLQLIGIRLDDTSPILRIPLRELVQRFDNRNIRIVTIHRRDRSTIPRGDDILSAGDQDFFLCKPQHQSDVISFTGKVKTDISNVMILGGGLVGQFIARDIGKNIHVKIVESNEDKAGEIADLLPRSLIIHGDGTDIDLLAVEGLMDMDAVISVTGSDETNIISTLVARHLRVPRTIALVNTVEYMPVTTTIGMDAVVSKQLLTVNAVQRYIRQHQIASIASIPGVDAQIIEFIAKERSKITRKPLREIGFPPHAIAGAIVHDGRAEIISGDTHIQPGDKVAVFMLPQALRKVEKLFK